MALEEMKALSFLRGVAGAFEGSAYLAAGSDSWPEAALLLGAAKRIRDVTRMPLQPHWLRSHGEVEARVHGALGADFERRRQAGETLPFEEAVALCRSILS